MVDNVPITAGSGTNVASDDVGGVQFQRVKPSWGVDGAAVDASLTDPLPTQAQGIAYAGTSGNIAAGGTGTIGPLAVPTAGNVSVIVKNQVAANAWAGAPVLVFEQSDDNTSWSPVQTVRNDNGAVASTHVLPAGAASSSLVFECGMESVGWFRVRCTTGPTTNPITIVIAAGSLPFNPIVASTDRKDAARTSLMLYAAGASAAATSTIALITLAPIRGITTSGSTSSFALTAGKTFRITGIRIGHVGHATGTAATSTFHVRLSTSGAVTTTTTPILMQARVQTPATSNAAAFYEVPLGDGYEIPVPAGASYQIGITATSTYTTNAPTLDVHILGYEY